MDRDRAHLHRHCRRGAFCVGLLSLLVSPVTLAQHSPALDRVSIALGGYYPTTDTTLSASDKEGYLRGSFNLEHDLDMDDRGTVGRVRMDFLVGARQGLSFDYFSYRRGSSDSLSREIDFEGTPYDIDAWARGKLEFDFGSTAWRWWFGDGNDVFGFGLGISYYRVTTRLRGEVSLNGEVIRGHSASNDHALAPLLTLGWRHAFSPNLRMYFDASGVTKHGGRLSGQLYNAALGMEWFPWGHLGVGVEYGVSRIQLTRAKRYYNAHLDLKLHGPSAFARLRF